MEIEDNSVLDYNNEHNFKKGSITKYNIDKSDVAFQDDQFTQPEDPKKSFENSNQQQSKMKQINNEMSIINKDVE